MENKEIRITNNAKDIIAIEESIEKNILSKNVIMSDIKSNSTTYAVYYIDEVPIGYLAYSYCVDHIDIISVAVIPEFRHKKIATSLINYLFNKYNNIKIFLEVRKSNTPAISLYESLNFKCISTRKNYYSSPIEDALIFVTCL